MIFLIICIALVCGVLLTAFDYKDLKFRKTDFSFLEFLLHFILILLFSFYIFRVFNENYLFYINYIAFMGIYISSVTDIKIRHIFTMIPLVFSVPIAILNYFGGYIQISILGIIAGLLLYLSIYLLGKLIYKREAFGIGDIYVLMFIGLATDWFTVINIGLFAFVICSVYYISKSIVLMDFKHLKNYEIPFVPFIAASYLILIYF